MQLVRSPALLACLFTVACASAPRRATPPPATVEPRDQTATAAEPGPAPDDLLNAAVWSSLSVEHDLVFREVYRDAAERLETAISDPDWDALSREERAEAGPAQGLPPAIVVDVDETVLDNGPYQTELIATGKEYDDVTWAEWCGREAAQPMPGSLAFARFAEAHGVKLFYLTNRARDLGPVTLDNLRKDGFPIEGDDAFLGLGVVVPGCDQTGSHKGCRRLLIGRRYRVLMQFGDQVGDFLDVVSNTLEGRRKVVEPYASWIGERWWVLPNPTYGSWEPALFDNQWALPRAERRRLKIEALEGQ